MAHIQQPPDFARRQTLPDIQPPQVVTTPQKQMTRKLYDIYDQELSAIVTPFNRGSKRAIGAFCADCPFFLLSIGSPEPWSGQIPEGIARVRQAIPHSSVIGAPLSGLLAIVQAAESPRAFESVQSCFPG
jgi:hypothetical protein